jgi:hypothetical protein
MGILGASEQHHLPQCAACSLSCGKAAVLLSCNAFVTHAAFGRVSYMQQCKADWHLSAKHSTTVMQHLALAWCTSAPLACIRLQQLASSRVYDAVKDCAGPLASTACQQPTQTPALSQPFHKFVAHANLCDVHAHKQHCCPLTTCAMLCCCHQHPHAGLL